MPYQFVFVPWPSHRPWPGLAQAERSHGAAPGREFEQDERDAWNRVAHRVGPVLGAVEHELTATAASLESTADRIRLTLRPSRAELTVPDDESAAGDTLELMQKAYAVARIVEAETGLRGYDPQLGEPVTDDPLHLVGSRAADETEPDEPARSPFAPSAADPGRLDEPSPRPAVRKRPWWRFW